LVPLEVARSALLDTVAQPILPALDMAPLEVDILAPLDVQTFVIIPPVLADLAFESSQHR
jgi:hypothetical protein